MYVLKRKVACVTNAIDITITLTNTVLLKRSP